MRSTGPNNMHVAEQRFIQLVRKHQKKRKFSRPRHRWKDNLMWTKEDEGLEWVEATHNSNDSNKLHGSINGGGDFLTSYVAISFSRETLC
jgi:hypothetical protein